MALATLAIGILPAKAQLATYTFQTGFNPTGNPSHATVSSFSAHGTGISQSLEAYNAVGYDTGGSVNSTTGWPTENLDENLYVGFTITADINYQLDLTELKFWSNHDQYGPIDFSISIYTDGNLFYQDPHIDSQAHAGWDDISMVLNDSDDLDLPLAQTVEFRFSPYGASQSTGLFRFDNVAIFGTVSPVPEPIHYAGFGILLILGLIGYQRFVRKTA